MTAWEKINKVLEDERNNRTNFLDGDINALIYLAYMMGREEAVKEVSDEYSAILSAQHKRAAGCRYHNMAEQIIGFKGTYIYHPEYSQDYTHELAPAIEVKI